jgi:hypothetical protein
MQHSVVMLLQFSATSVQGAAGKTFFDNVHSAMDSFRLTAVNITFRKWSCTLERNEMARAPFSRPAFIQT